MLDSEVAIYELIGSAIRRRRERVGMTQAVLAEKAGLSRTSLTNIERGGQAVLVHHLLRLAIALNVSPSALLPRSEIVTSPIAQESDVDDEFRRLLKKLGVSQQRSRPS